MDSASRKIGVVTGATSGIGRAAALRLARDGWHLVVPARDAARARRLAEEIRRETGRDIDVVDCDLASLASVRAAGEAIRARYPRIGLLVNNAGAVYTRFEQTVDGYERTFATNHLGPFLLTRLLLDSLRAAESARIVIVSSEAHKSGDVDFDDLQNERDFKGFEAYGRSKLMNLWFAYELARRLAGTGVTVNALHPGVVRSGFGDSARGLFRLGVIVARPFMISAERGSDTLVWLATAPDAAGATGKYFIRNREVRSRRRSYDEAAAARLWTESERLIDRALTGQ